MSSALRNRRSGDETVMRHERFAWATYVALVASAWLAVGPAAAQGVDNVVAKLGGAELTIADVRRMLDSQPAETRGQLTANAGLLDRFIRTEMIKRALADEARAKGFDRRPEVSDAMERARDQALVARYMTEQAKPPAAYPSEAEVAEAYRINSEEFTVPAQYRVSQIFLGFGDGAQKKDPEAVRRRIEEISKSVTAKPADFEAQAKRLSEHKSSADQGGDLGWVTVDQMVPEVRAVVLALKKGELAKPVKTATGWHLLKVADVKPKSLRPLAEVREALVRALRIRKAQENEQKYLDDLIVRTPLGVNEIALNRLLAPAAAIASPLPEKKP